MVCAMHLEAPRSTFRTNVLALLLAGTVGCGGKPSADPKNREIPWAYGPTNGTATVEHLQGSGHRGGAAIAKGWQCRLQDGKQLVVKPFELAAAHPLFGKVALSVSLFDKDGKEIGALVSPPITAQNATFTFDVAEAVVPRLWDLVIWYRKV